MSIPPMIARLTILLLLVLSLASGSVRVVQTCGPQWNSGACHDCCAEASACCVVSCGTAPKTPAAQNAPTSPAAKQVAAPVFILIGFSPAPVLERPAAHKRQAARMPVVPPLDRICVRLI